MSVYNPVKAKGIAMRMSASVAMIFALVASSSAHAAGASNYVHVTVIKVAPAGFTISTDGTDVAANDPDLCGDTASGAHNTYYLATSILNYESMYAALLTAQASGRTAKFWLNTCNGTQPKVETVWIRNQ
ncbi:MAG: hypothetical protein ACOZAA_09780 [Pseudomonadota bacterium]